MTNAELLSAPSSMPAQVTDQTQSAKPARNRKRAPFEQPSIPAQLNVAYTLIATVRDTPALQAALATCGYSPERLHQGLQHYHVVLGAEDRQQQAYAALIAATATLNALEANAKPAYSHDITVARLVCRADTAALLRLGLNDARLRRRGEWLLQAQQFYRTLLRDPVVLQRFAGYGIDRAQIEARRQLIEQVLAEHTVHLQITSAARSATAQRDDTLAALRTWLRDFWQIGRLALKGEPALLHLFELAARG